MTACLLLGLGVAVGIYIGELSNRRRDLRLFRYLNPPGGPISNTAAPTTTELDPKETT